MVLVEDIRVVNIGVAMEEEGEFMSQIVMVYAGCEKNGEGIRTYTVFHFMIYDFHFYDFLLDLFFEIINRLPPQNLLLNLITSLRLSLSPIYKILLERAWRTRKWIPLKYSFFLIFEKILICFFDLFFEIISWK